MHCIDVKEGIRDEKGDLRQEVTVEGIRRCAGGYRPVLETLKPYILA